MKLIKEPPPNWNQLYRSLKLVLNEAGETRKTAVLDNYNNKKEYICRKFGVISEKDVVRIDKQYRNNRRQND